MSFVMYHNVQDVPYTETQLWSIPGVCIIKGQCSSDRAMFYDPRKTSCRQDTITLLFWTREIRSCRLELTTSPFAKTKAKIKTKLEEEGQQQSKNKTEDLITPQTPSFIRTEPDPYL